MRRSASRRSRTLLLKARPPAMESPPDPDCSPPRAATHQAIDPSLRPVLRQGTRRVDGRLIVGLLVRRHEAELARETVLHEVVPRRVEDAVRERGQQDEQYEDE